LARGFYGAASVSTAREDASSRRFSLMSDSSPLARPNLIRVSAQPSRLETSLGASWNGALFAVVTTAAAGEIHRSRSSWSSSAG
jgi:hypothetical protein